MKEMLSLPELIEMPFSTKPTKFLVENRRKKGFQNLSKCGNSFRLPKFPAQKREEKKEAAGLPVFGKTFKLGWKPTIYILHFLFTRGLTRQIIFKK